MRIAFVLLLALIAMAAQAQTASGIAASTPPAQSASVGFKPSAPSQPSSAPPKPHIAPAPASTASGSTSTFDSILDTAEKILRILAYGVGGAWVYFNYVKGRTHKARLKVRLSGTRLESKAPHLAKITAQVENVGLSKCELLDIGSGLRLQGYDATKLVDQWTSLATYDLLTKNNHWIEPGVTIEEQLLVPIDTETYAAFRVELVLNSKDVRWKTAAIL